MIPFDASKLRTEIVFLKQITTAMGGSMIVLSNPDDNVEQSHRVNLPLALARKFIKSHTLSKYLIPVPTAVVWYGDSVVSLERHPLSSLGVDKTTDTGSDDWVPHCFTAVESGVKHATVQYDWFFDGRYAYTFGPSLNMMIGGATPCSIDETFRILKAKTIDLYTLNTGKMLGEEIRECLAFVSSTGEYAVTSPLWETARKMMSCLHDKKTADDVEDVDEDDEVNITYGELDEDNINRFWLDRLNAEAKVNLGFALYAGNSLGKIFNYNYIDPLGLPELMVELCTVNMPNIDVSVRSTYPISMTFTQALAWCMGMLRDQTDHVKYITVLKCIKYLCKRGMFKAELLNKLFVTESTDVPLINAEIYRKALD